MEATEPQQTADITQPKNATTEAEAPPAKPIHALVVDTGPLIKNDPPVSTLLAQANELYTLPSVISEIRDAATKARVETTLLPFLKLRSPKPESVKFITDFARRTGDLEVLSRPDIHLIALTYELECENNGGDWRLRKTPAQKGLNGKPPTQETGEKQSDAADQKEESAEGEVSEEVVIEQDGAEEQNPSEQITSEDNVEVEQESHEQPKIQQEIITQALDNLSLEPSALPTVDTAPNDAATSSTKPHEEEIDDDEGWITPANLKKHQAKDQLSAPVQPIQKLLKAALLTSDFAMQNVALRINLNLVSPKLARVTRVKTWVLRCHGCFQVTRDTAKQFCPRCGQATLTRVSCSTDAATGSLTIHLKKNFQWNNRGNVYSVPKPVHGAASGKARGPGGGKGGWGRELILAEDQKEYLQKATDQKRARQRDLMDEDYLPGILTGDRGNGGAGGRIRVGAGRTVNSRKR